jgi:hypothetical protein
MLQRFVIAPVAPIYHTNPIGHSKAAILEGWIINHTYPCKGLAVAVSRTPFGRWSAVFPSAVRPIALPFLDRRTYLCFCV